ncbi:hypothetical protein K8I61_13560 [bacterium]|nr:hypothetical protein [bacterium]
MPDARKLYALLVILALLLAADIAIRLGALQLVTPRDARADIVSGKNHFSTHSPDGRSVYLWYYEFEGVATRNATVEYLGKIDVDGTFMKSAR